MITELYALPGAGKTTIIKSITGGKATSIQGVVGIQGYVMCFLKKLVVYLPSSMRYKQKMKRIMRSYSKDSIYISISLKRHYNNIVMVALAYKYMQKNIYMDEGIIHRIITLAVNFSVSEEDLFSMIDIFRPSMTKVISYYLDVTLEECMKSIIIRDRHECEMDELDSEQLLEFLKEYEHYCLAICKHYNHAIVSRENYEVMRRKL